MTARLRNHSVVVLISITISLMLLTVAGFSVQTVTAKAKDNQVTVAGYELIGTVDIPTGTQFEGTEVGGLSSITYDPHRDVYYAISDDQGTIDPVRYYTLDIDLSDGQLDPGDITFLEVTTIMHAADVAVLPYAASLNSGAALLAATFGVPIVAPRIGPFVEMIEAGLGLGYDPAAGVSGIAGTLRLVRDFVAGFDSRTARDYASRFDPVEVSDAFLSGLLGRLDFGQADA